MEYATNGKGNLGVALGAIGTGLGALGNMGWLSGGMNNRFGGGYGFEGGCRPGFVTKYELDMSMAMAQKDSEIAMLKAESDSEQKMIDVYKQTRSEIKALEDKVEANRRDQDAWNANQSVANAHMSGMIAANTNSIVGIKGILDRITAIRVPNNAVCPGWGDVTVTPVTPEP